MWLKYFLSEKDFWWQQQIGSWSCSDKHKCHILTHQVKERMTAPWSSCHRVKQCLKMEIIHACTNIGCSSQVNTKTLTGFCCSVMNNNYWHGPCCQKGMWTCWRRAQKGKNSREMKESLTQRERQTSYSWRNTLKKEQHKSLTLLASIKWYKALPSHAC